MPGDKKSRDWREALQAKNHQGWPSPHKSGERHGTGSPLESPQGPYLADTLISDFRLRAVSLLLEDTLFMVLGCGSPRKLVQGQKIFSIVLKPASPRAKA